MIKPEEIQNMKVEVAETESLINYAVSVRFPLSQNTMIYLIERVRFLKRELADFEADSMKELQKQIKCN